MTERTRRPRRRHRRQTGAEGAAGGEVREELVRLSGERGARLHERVMEAADAFADGRDRDAVRILEPVRKQVPDAAGVRELLGLALYRSGRYRAARDELEEFRRLTGSTEQHPVLMDCYRAERRFDRVDELWAELREASLRPELVVEGRIVVAGALADRGELGAALHLLDQRARKVRRPRPADLRLLYALADLEERAGNLPRARTLFRQVADADPDLTDARERLRALA